MNILIYTTDYWYKEQLVIAFNNIANKANVKFDIANLVDAKMYAEQKAETNYNLIIFDEDSFSLDYLLKILLNCKDSDKNIIYLRTVKHNKYMIDHTRKRIRDIMRTFYSESMWVLQDIVELCNIINKLGTHKNQIVIKQDNIGFIDNDNILDFVSFFRTEFEQEYQEGICLLMQVQYVLSKLKDERSTTK